MVLIFPLSPSTRPLLRPVETMATTPSKYLRMVAAAFLNGFRRERRDQPLDVETIEDDLGRRRSAGHGLDVGRRHVHGDALELGGAFGTEGVEEAPDRCHVLPLGRPDHALLDVVDDDGQVLVMATVR